VPGTGRGDRDRRDLTGESAVPMTGVKIVPVPTTAAASVTAAEE